MGRVVFVAASEAQAQVVRDLLASRGIETELSGAWRASLRGVLPIGDTSVALEVHDDEDVEPARAALAELDTDDAAGTTWACRRCGEDVPGGFAVCWKCGAPIGAAPIVTAPLRAEVHAPDVDVAEPPANRRRAWGDLLCAVLLGALPVALLSVWFSHVSVHLDSLSAFGRIGLDNLLVGLELALCVSILRRRGFQPGIAWGGRERWLGDLGGAVFLGLALVVIHWVVHVTANSLGVPVAPAASLPPQDQETVALDMVFLLFPGVGVAAANGALVIYGVVLPRLRVVLRSTLAAVVLTAACATLTWAATASWAARVDTFVSGILLGGAFLVVGRVWPIALASFIGYVFFYLPVIQMR